ncbi:uncharacterized protein MELLADRAFT_105828 [Melampsora larici-populina 98AG31]|uniref:Uncharacterized protein n=1 Tax=Melampsora larici-populina (strain 98AG31 / pathotype 3-4-7) TaxID=747676 RepID=F4RJG8_MELLP|nr:uncharacterized protein MELLADRAFT_105828 [Melampsora larici-populina 98AG31]EGG07308.1 hypothetical protein MELLADRAFT_105828 [Melampsora larici-populina 98AG31]
MLFPPIWTSHRHMRRNPQTRDSMARYWMVNKHTCSSTMSSVTSERPSRSRKQTSNPGLIPQSPDLRRRVSIESIILAKSQNKRKKQSTGSTVTVITSDEESVAGVIESEGSLPPSPKRKKSKAKAKKHKKQSSKSDEVSTH